MVLSGGGGARGFWPLSPRFLAPVAPFQLPICGKAKAGAGGINRKANCATDMSKMPQVGGKKRRGDSGNLARNSRRPSVRLTGIFGRAGDSARLLFNASRLLVTCEMGIAMKKSCHLGNLGMPGPQVKKQHVEKQDKGR